MNWTENCDRGRVLVRKERVSMKGFIVALAFLLALPFVQSFSLPPAIHPFDKASERRIDSLLLLMTLEEKAGQLTQYTARWTDPGVRARLIPDQEALIRRGKVGSLLNAYGADVTRRIQEIAVKESRLGIPLLFGYDVIHGLRTVFPIPLGEASTWDPGLVEKAARVAATEAAAMGIHWTFAPMVDIARDPRWGRIAEGSGEDPYLGAAMAAAHVRGFQGDDLSKPNTILACPKHFAAYGGAEGGRDYNSVDISERTLRDVYLPPFEAAVKAGAATIMCSFNEIAGVPSTGNRQLLTDILRKEWGFDGFVVSDWGSIGELRAHGFASSDAEAARLALTAGTDMDMEGNLYGEQLEVLVRSGKLAESVVDEAVRRILRAKIRLGLFDDPYRYCSAARERSLILHPDHRALARDVARRSMVLLKNDKNLLPLNKQVGTLAVIGPLAADSINPLGTWDALGRPADVVTVLEGIRNAVLPQTTVLYARGCALDSQTTDGFAEAVAAVRRADVVVMVLGEASSMSGEASCRSVLGLPGNQEVLLKTIHAVGKPIVAVLMNGRPLTIPWLDQQIPAILEAWMPGVEAGKAVADVIFGDCAPSGKLPVTFPRGVGQVPIYYNHKSTGRPADDTVKYTSRYLDLPSTPLYPFGYGMSYTRFTYGRLTLSASRIREGESIRVGIEVQNTGDRAGEETVQLYVQDEFGSVTRPVKELKGFRKILLAPGEKRNVEFMLSTKDLAFTTLEMSHRVEPGTFKVFAGGNSRDVITSSFEIVTP
jgi:beta-glucosidase